jgi:hypothetical protein
MSKKRIVGVILALFMVFSIPTPGFAAEDTTGAMATNEVATTVVEEEEELGSVKFDPELDVKEVIQIAFVGEEGLDAYKEPNNENDALATLEPGVVLYVYEIEKVEVNDTIVEWLKVKVDDSEIFYFIERDLIVYVSEDSGYVWTPPVVYSGGEGSSGGSGYSGGGGSGNSGYYRITEFCSACNSPRGTDITASGHAYLGGAAFNDAPLGATIHVEGRGSFTVMDRSGARCVDIWTGWSDSCHCSGNSFAYVTW